MWLNLMFKAVKADKSRPRVAAFVKRVLQALGMHQPPFICGALYMLGQVGYLSLLLLPRNGQMEG